MGPIQMAPYWLLALCSAALLACPRPAWSFELETPLSNEASQPSVSPKVKVESPKGYGVDVSFPIHHKLQEGTFQRARYDDFMKGCYNKYNRADCDISERARKKLNLMQPPTQDNYTKLGFAKTKAPKKAFDALQQFWNKHQGKETVEDWPSGNTYTNHWALNPTYMLSLEDGRMREGRRIKNVVWDAVKAVLEEWTGEKLRPTSLYGIRIYKEGAILSSHVDRLPLVSSAIINVAQDLDEPWPVEVYDHDGNAYNVSMEPGDMVLYESHTCVHGRPAPLQGRFYANVFVHFIPVDHEGHDKNEGDSARLAFGKKAPKIGGHEQEQHTADELEQHRREHEEEAQARLALMEGKAKQQQRRWHRDGGEEEEEEEEYTDEFADADFSTGSTPLHFAAATGDVQRVKELISKGGGEYLISVPDENNWHPIHEAARGGHLEVVKSLAESGADLGATTFQGGTALWWARKTHGNHHDVVQYLESIGAPDHAEL